MSKTQITVIECAGCPFYERNAVNIAADFLFKKDTHTGTCRFGGLGKVFPFGRRHIPDERSIPVDCPLKAGDAIVSLGLSA